MSSPISFPLSRSGLYIPVHRRTRSEASSSPSSSRASSPGRPTALVYSPADLLSLAHSPLAHQSAGEMDTRLREIAPEVVQTRRQRKALAWHARHTTPSPIPTPSVRTSTRRVQAPSSESDEDRSRSWRRA